MNKIMNSKALLICAIGFLVALPVFASVYEGSLCTGVNCPVEGTVIAAPTASPVAGTYTSTQSVTLTATGATSIRYTTDGTTPTCASTQYSSAISVTSSKTIKAISCYANNASSTVASFAYTISIPSSGGGDSYTPPTTTTTSPTTTTTTTKPVTTTTTTKPVSQMTPQEVRVEITKLAALVMQLQAQLKELIGKPSAIPPTTIPPVTITGIPAGFTFQNDLWKGKVSEDVRYLQMFLNSRGFTVSNSGSGSLGNETTFFGSLTKNALAKFQASVGISPAVGYFGPLTRAYINTH